MTRNQRLHLSLALSIVVTLAVTLLIINPTIVQATPTSSGSIDIQVDHVVQIRNGGLVVINDTVKLSTKPGENVEPLQNFLMGFPFIYRSNLIYVFAYDVSNQPLDVKLDVGLGKIGFYGVEVGFSQIVNISNGGHYEFTVVSVFSDLIWPRILPFEPEPGKVATLFNATFPAYPSLIQEVSVVNLTIVLPSNVNSMLNSFDMEGIEFTNRTAGAFQVLNYTKTNLKSFAYEPFWLTFEGIDEAFHIIEVEKVKREIAVNSWRQVLVTDSYEVIPKAGNLSKLNVQLLPSAFKISAWDKFGHPIPEEDLQIEQTSPTTPTNVTLTFSPKFRMNKLARFELTYQVPWKNIVNQSDWQSYRIALSSGNFNLLIRKLVIVLTLPEGARFIRLPETSVVQKDAFQETMTLFYFNVTPFQNLPKEATYEYAVFWVSFRPTLWVGTAVAILGVLALLWRAPRPAAPIPTIPVSPEELKSYVDAYEEKRRSIREIERLEERARKGRIPRRRYKVRKRALESRLSVLSKDLARLREKLRAASSKYADMMRRIEIAEAELEGIEAGVRRTETRYRRGEISTAAYHKLLEDYYRRREKARTTIDGILLRLREEIA